MTIAEQGEGAGGELLRAFLLGEKTAVARVETILQRAVSWRGYYIPLSERPDLVRESVLELYEALSRPGIALREGLPAFARAVAYRRCVDWMRKNKKKDSAPPVEESLATGPDDALLQRETRELGARVLAALRDACREIIRLHAGDGLTYREIADRQGRSEGALRVQMSQCLKEARALLGRFQRNHETARSVSRRSV